MKLKVNNVILTPGSIIGWQEYPWYKRIIAKLKKDTLPPNKFFLLKTYIKGDNILLTDKSELYIYKPFIRYSNKEIQKLRKADTYFKNKSDLIEALTSIRSNDDIELNYNTYCI